VQFSINDRIFWHSLGEWACRYLAIAQTGFVDCVDDLLGAFFLADPAARAQLFVDIASFLADSDREIAHISIHPFYLAPGQQVIFGCEPADTILGVRIQAEQSRVGKVLSNWAMCPPMEGSRSTR
jgi:hypothetical protein